MSFEDEFFDYYEILQVSPGCSATVLEAAYRNLAKVYHPDHAETADIDKFSAVVAAYTVLRDPEKRAAYDARHAAQVQPAASNHAASPDPFPNEVSAVKDAEAHARILFALYQKRRENAQDAGVVRFYIQDMLGCSDENFEFHVWYLKSKGLIETTEHGTLAITIEGVDHVISTSRAKVAEQRLITESTDRSVNG
jgi:curved DNA-binding protein